jgi:hypothetical protein
MLLIVVTLGATAAYTYYLKKNKEAPADEQTFHIDNTDAITKIFMADKTGKKVLLEKNNKSWIVNKKHKAFQAKVDLLLETMRRIRVYHPVTEKQWNTVVRELATTAVKVEIYLNNESTPTRVYYVGNPTTDGYGTYMIAEINGKVAQRPYVVYIPGFNGNVTPRYFLDEKDWRDLSIFNYSIDNIQSVSVQWLEQPSESFTFIRAGRDSFYMPENDVGLPLFKTGVNKFLNSFTYLNAESLENENPLKDSVLVDQPFLTITVTPVKGKPTTMQLFHMGINKRSKTQFDEQGNPLPYDLDRYWALVDNGLGFVVVQDYVFGKIMRKKRDFFLQKPV